MKINFQKFIEGKFEKLQAENGVYLKQKDEKINSLKEEIKKVKIKIII